MNHFVVMLRMRVIQRKPTVCGRWAVVLSVYSLNVFTEFAEFSDKNNIIFEKIAVLNPLSPVREIDTLPLYHRDTANREDS